MSAQIFVILETKKIELQFDVSQKFEVPNPVVGHCEYSQKLLILGPNATTAPLLLVSEIRCFSVI